MSEIPKIEVGVPVPPDVRRTRRPWRELNVGDSFLLDGWDGSRDRENYFRTHACIWGKRLGLKFSVRKTEEGLKVWRVA